MTHSLMIIQQDVLPTLLEFPTRKAAEIAARELRVKSDSLQIINNTSGRVTNFSSVLEAEARAEEELSAAMYQTHIDSLPEEEIRRICRQHKEKQDRQEERYRAKGWGETHYSAGVPPLHYAVKHRMDKIEEHDKTERQWAEAMEELCGVSRGPVNTRDQAPAFTVPQKLGITRAADNSLILFCLWGGLMLVVAAAAYAFG